MKSKSVALLFALATSILGLTVGLLAADKAVDKATPKAPPIKKPTLKIDASPIGEVKGVVTSYADALEAIRPAVVSVYSSKIVRQQVKFDVETA